ncbi:uncharacterized protein LOC143921416 [Arctopsyche grandis]|uniref:uncharacterized protein LOC143921416 n=1 Tax=Arctopsyche grandis TaxID=121162 RepID=UPI00406D6477
MEETDEGEKAPLVPLPLVANRCSAGRVKQRRSITLWMKAEMVRRHELGATPTAISRAFDVPRTTVVTILKDKRRIKEYVQADTPPQATVIRAGLVADVERLLTLWIREQTAHQVALSTATIQDKARDIYHRLRLERGDDTTTTATTEPFTASKGWFLRFKTRTNLFAEPDDEEVTNMFPNVQVIEKKPDDDTSSGFEESFGKNMFFKQELPSPDERLECTNIKDIKDSYDDMIYENLKRFKTKITKLKRKRDDSDGDKFQASPRSFYSPKTVDVENEFEIFGKHIAVQLQQFPLDCAIEIQSEIQQMLCQKRLQLLHR